MKLTENISVSEKEAKKLAKLSKEKLEKHLTKQFALAGGRSQKVKDNLVNLAYDNLNPFRTAKPTRKTGPKDSTGKD